MIKLSKLTDYAVVVMVQFGKENAGALKSAHAIADKTGIPEPTVAKVLKVLVKENLVESIRGAAGGYRLARPAGNISVGDVIAAMDGPIGIVTCTEGGQEECTASARCPAMGKWDHLNRLVRDVFQSVKITDMAVTGCGTPYNFVSTAGLQKEAV